MPVQPHFMTNYFIIYNKNNKKNPKNGILKPALDFPFMKWRDKTQMVKALEMTSVINVMQKMLDQCLTEVDHKVFVSVNETIIK